MHRIEFDGPKTALEIREPMMEACRIVAADFDLFAVFDQRQQPAFDGYASPARTAPKRSRIGNGKHKNWEIHYQSDPPATNRPEVVGIIAVRTEVDKDRLQFGGFDYGKFGEDPPTYRYITLQPASEIYNFRPVDPSPELWTASVEAIEKPLLHGPRLF